MTIKQFIEKAIGGGWKPHDHFNEPCDIGDLKYAEILLDPLAWKAVGKVEGWYDSKELIPNSWIMKHVELILDFADVKSIKKNHNTKRKKTHNATTSAVQERRVQRN